MYSRLNLKEERKMTKAILILDNIDETEIEELRADILLNLYGDLYGFYKNMTLISMPKKKKEYEEQISRDNDFYEKGWNDCIDEILGEHDD